MNNLKTQYFLDTEAHHHQSHIVVVVVVVVQYSSNDNTIYISILS